MDVDTRYQELYAKAKSYHQEHIFTFWNSLTLDKQITLLQQVEHVDFKLIADLYAERHKKISLLDEIKPANFIDKHVLSDTIKRQGEEALRAGKYAVFLLAGGQASRLGFDGPKGCFPVTALKKKTLFQLYAEKILAANKKYNTTIELYIMLGEHNYDTSVQFFEAHDYFGLEKKAVFFFKQQGQMPAVDCETGDLLLAKKHELFFAPNGTGDVYRSLQKAELLKHMREKGIEFFHYVQIDDALVNIADPYLVGYHVSQKAEITINGIEKTDPNEPIGVVVQHGHATRIAEYIYMPPELSAKKNADGKLTFRAGSPAIFVMNVDFAERAANSPYVYYSSKKKVPYIDDKGNLVEPEKLNAYKFESFNFDAFPLAKKVATLVGKREEEFGPIKNPDSSDNKSRPVIQKMMTALFKKWLITAGISKDLVHHLEVVEISPLLALAEEDLVKYVKGHESSIEKQLKGKKKVYLE